MKKKQPLAALEVIYLPGQLLSYSELWSISSLAGSANEARVGVWASGSPEGQSAVFSSMTTSGTSPMDPQSVSDQTKSAF